MKKIYFIILMLVAYTAVQSQTIRRWVGASGGSWATATNWQVGVGPTGGATGVPATNDIVYLNTGTSITIANVPTMTLSSLIVTSNSTFTLTGAGGTQTLTIGNGVAGDDLSITAGSTLIQANSLENIVIANNNTANVAGAFTVNGTYNTNGTGVVTTVVASTGTINNVNTVTSTNAARLLVNGTYIHAINGGTIPTATWDDASTCNVTGVSNTVPAGLNPASGFGNFIWDCNQGNNNIDLGGNLVNIDGDFTILKTSTSGTGRLFFTQTNTFTLDIDGSLIIGQNPSAGNLSVYFTYNDDGDATINVGGDYLHRNGNLSFVSADGTGDSNNGTLNVTGNFLQSGGAIDFAVDGGAAANATTQKGAMTLTGNFTQTAGTMSTNSTDGDVLNGLITFNGTAVQNFTTSVAGDQSLKYLNYLINAGSTVKLFSNLFLVRDVVANWESRFTVNGTLDASTFTIAETRDAVSPANNATADAFFVLNAGAKLITAHANGVPGSINPANRLAPTYNSGADFEFQSTSATAITGIFTTTTANTARNIIINTTGTDIELSQPMAVTGYLYLQDGEFTTTTLNVITINVGAKATGVVALTADTYNNGSFVVGPIRAVRTNAAPNNTFTFPTGKTGVGLIPIAIAGINGNSTYEAEYISQPASARGSAAAAGLTQTDYCQYWELFKTTGAGSPASVTLYWNANSKCSATPYVTAPASLRIGRSTGVGASPGWSASGGTATSVTPFTTGSITWTLAAATLPTTQTLYTLGSTLVTENPLPVTLANVSAFEKNSGVQVDWSNLTEKDVVDYEVERSLNGKDFTTVISKQAAKANQDARADYTAFDATPVQGANFYRIKVKETSGKVLYSKTLRVDKGSAKKGFSVYPNPVTGNQLNIGMVNLKQGKYSIQVINSGGQNIYQKNIVTQSNATTQTLQLPSSVKPGVYSMVVTGDDYRETKMFVVQ